MPGIIASVGRGGANRRDDVITVQSLLNRVPAAAGGPRPALTVDGVCGGMTNAAIAAFQMFHFRNADGRIDPGRQTIARLLEIAGQMGPASNGGGTAPGSAPAPSPAPAPDSVSTAGLSPLRAKIIELAMAEATPAPGKVTDRMTVIDAGQTCRKGWDRLKQYIEETVVTWTPAHWNNADNWNGLRTPGKRVSGLHWCGIFSCFILKQAGLTAQWHLGQGIKPVPKIWGYKGVQPGDIGIIAHQAHHFVITEVGADKVTSVNGNSDWQSILVKSWPLRDIVAYHKVD